MKSDRVATIFDRTLSNVELMRKIWIKIQIKDLDLDKDLDKRFGKDLD